uniref:7TM_GPCR_Srx domain-containing protein n=1 Tax=Elaeophora elaphi TaxID=1147741 RepID=A0A0R3RMR3_9BILA
MKLPCRLILQNATELPFTLQSIFQFCISTSLIRPIIWFIVQATTSITIVVTALGYFDFSSSGKYCYSCMSEAFRKHWSFLSQVALSLLMKFHSLSSFS